MPGKRKEPPEPDLSLVPTTPTTPTKSTKKGRRNKNKDHLKGWTEFSVKQGLNAILRLPALRPHIINLVQSVSLWTYHVYNLLNLHTHRLLDNNLTLEITASFVDHAFTLITNTDKGNVNRELKITYDTMYKNLFPEIKVPLERTQEANFACHSERELFMTMAKNNIVVHYYTRHCKWFKLKLIQYFSHNNMEIPKKLGKIVHPLYKLSVQEDVEMKQLEQIIPDLLLRNYCELVINESRMWISRGDTDNSRFPVTSMALKAKWCEYLPWMRKINQDFSSWQTQVKQLFDLRRIDERCRNKLLRGFRLFSIIPKAKMGLRHIAIDNNVLRPLLVNIGVKNLPSRPDWCKDNAHEKWWDMAFYGHKKKPFKIPGYYIRTDGIAASIMYYRPDPNPKKKKTKPKNSTKSKKRKKNQDVDELEEEIKFVKPPDIPDNAKIIGLDPGKRDIFATSSGEGLKRERKRSRMSGNEYRQSSGEMKRRHKASIWMDKLRSTLPSEFKELSHKVSSSRELVENHFESIRNEFSTLWNYYSARRHRRLKFDAYIRSMSAIDMACRRILDSVKGEDKVVVAFGQARFHGTKGCPTAPTKRLYHRLSKIYKNRCWVVDIDEYGTSKMCPQCGDKLYNVVGEKEDTIPRMTREGKLERVSITNEIIYSLKACKKCLIVCDRDVDIGAYNIWKACRMEMTEGGRPIQRREGGIGDLETVSRLWNHRLVMIENKTNRE